MAPGRCRLRKRPSTRDSVNGEDYRPNRAAGLGKQWPAGLGPTGYVQQEVHQNSAGRYPLISSPMQISTSVGVVQYIRVSLRSIMTSNLS